MPGLSAQIVGKVVEIESLCAQAPERLVENEAQESDAEPLSGAADGDPLEVEIRARVAEPRKIAKASIAPPAPIPSR